MSLLEQIIGSAARFDAFFVTSRNANGYRDLEHARAILGWQPVDSADAA